MPDAMSPDPETGWCAMPSDPLPLSPETKAGKALLTVLDPEDVRRIIAIEQEARTLARAEVIAEAKATLDGLRDALLDAATLLPPDRYPLLREATQRWYTMSDRAYHAALSRLGERE
jgi:hypothetical protein